MDLAAFADLDPAKLAALLPAFLASFIADPAVAERARHLTAEAVAQWPPSTGRELLDMLATLGDEPRLYEAHPAGRAISRGWCEALLPDPTVEGVEHLREAVDAGPTFLIGNHLSYLDSTAIDAALAAAGAADLADLVISLAGPKVYNDPFRRFASGCLSTVPVPQSTQLGHATSLPPRELARRAVAAIAAAHDALAAGRVLLVYAEGSRTRTGRLQPFLPGVARYLKVADARIVPFALSGTERIMPVGSARVSPGSVRLVFGEALPIASAGGPREALDAAHAAVSAILPAELRPE